MNLLSPEMQKKATREAIYNLYLYLSDKTPIDNNESLLSIVKKLEQSSETSSSKWKLRDFIRLNILKNSTVNDPILAFTTISKLEKSKEGATVGFFKRPDGEVSIVFKGTGSGEWIDNGEGLSGISKVNTYITYKSGINIPIKNIIIEDYATDMQAQALNWFNRNVYENGWDKSHNITVSGHSKGGNKAQFVALNSDIIDICYSFNGQGFSPEMIEYSKKKYGEDYYKRIEKIFNLSADNDYVNVLGTRLAPKENIYYFKGINGLHYIESILSPDGTLNNQTPQGKFSHYIEDISDELMDLPPKIRKYATLGAMNIFRKYLGKQTENSTDISDEETLVGIAISIGALLKKLKKQK